MNTLCENAIEYLNRGFSIHPVGRDKKPLLSTWKEFQTRKPTEDEVKKWFTSFPDANIAIITGEISGIVVVDVDEGGSTEGLTPTVMSSTGGRGFHFYYKHPGSSMRNSVGKLRDKVDFRGDGGYVLAPPSVSYKGPYHWEVDICTAEPVELPDWIVEFNKEDKKDKIDWQNFSREKNQTGSRNNSATQYVGKLLHDLSPGLWESAAWPAVLDWNQKSNQPPLEVGELRAVFESIANAETKARTLKNEEGGDEKQSEILIRHAKPMLKLFKDEMKEAYAVIKNGDHDEIWPINTRNKKFRLWLTKIGRDKLKKTPSEMSVKEAVVALEADAYFDGDLIPLYNRVAPGENGSIWIDMADERWRAIHVDRDGWKIVENPPALFKRYQHQLPMVEPETEGNISLLGPFLNVTDKEYLILIYAFLVCCLIPDIAVACLILHGVQGSSKTTVFKFLRSLVDPSVLEVLDLHESRREIVQLLDHHRVCFFDNLSGFGRNTSDLLSKIITGSGFSQRELYSTDTDVMRVIKKPVGLNGINLAASQADLLERSIAIEMEQIDPDRRKSEESLKAEFDLVKGKILGGILTVLSATLKKYPEVEHTNLPRMTDYALYGEAMSQVLGNQPDLFKSVYWKNINETTEKGIQSNIVASAILVFLSTTPEWSGTATALYEILSDVAVMNKIIPGPAYKWWPQEPNKLSEQINLVKPMLRLKNIEVTGQRTSTERTVRLINKDFSIKAENMNQIIPSTSTQLSIVRSKSSLEVNGYDASEAGEAPPEDAELDSEDILDQIDF